MNPRTRHLALAAGEVSSRVRAARSAVRQRIRSGELPLAQVMADPPDELRKDLLINVIGLAPWWGKARLEALGRAAAHDGINLIIPLGRAAADTRRWVAEHTARGALDGLCGLTFEQRIEVRAQDRTLDAAQALIEVIREHRRMVRSEDAAAEDFARADAWLWDRADKLARELEPEDTRSVQAAAA